MSFIPEVMLRRRRELSSKYLTGQGIEIGALHHPLEVSEKASVRYVDRLSNAELRLHYPELREFSLVSVDIIDDGEKLSRLEDESLDFIIANHMLEHCENPLAAIRNHLCKIRGGGILYYAIPDQRYGFDLNRPLTSFTHLVQDDRRGPESSRQDHFHEWSRLVRKKTSPQDVHTEAKRLMELNYSIHFHVWNAATFHEFLLKAQAYLKRTFGIAHFEQNDTEIIAVLKKELSNCLPQLSWIWLRSCLSRLRNFSLRDADFSRIRETPFCEIASENACERTKRLT